MRKLLVGVAVLLLLAPALAFAGSNTRTLATVVSVDLKAKSMTFSFTIDEKSYEETATWDDKTYWYDQSHGEELPKPATADLAKTLQKGSGVFVEARDGVFTGVIVKALATKM
jgi:hypothetical protein